MLSRIVNVHHVDFVGFSKGDIDYRDPEEIVMVFDCSPTFVDVVGKVRSELNWMDTNDVVVLQGRYNVGYDHYIRWKIMPIDSENRWEAYKAVVLDSQDKLLELFATRKVDPRRHIDLNVVASASERPSPGERVEPRVEAEPEVYDTTMSQPPLTQPLSPVLNNQYDRHDNDDNHDERVGLDAEGDDAEGDPGEHGFRNHDIGDVEANCLEEDMDHDMPYSRAYTLDSEYEGPEEEIDEDGLTAVEAKAFKKAFGRDERTPLFCDLRLARKAIVDGGTSKDLGPRSYSKKETKLNSLRLDISVGRMAIASYRILS